jgi:hypothetical protein
MLYEFLHTFLDMSDADMAIALRLSRADSASSAAYARTAPPHHSVGHARGFAAACHEAADAVAAEARWLMEDASSLRDQGRASRAETARMLTVAADLRRQVRDLRAQVISLRAA